MAKTLETTTMTVTTAPPRLHITLDDFMTGLLAGLAVEGIKRVSIRGSLFYAATESAYRAIRDGLEGTDLRLRFRISRNAVYGDSPEVRSAITKAVQRDLISLDNPVYLDMTLKVNTDDAPAYLKSLPGGSDIYRDAARAFLDAYTD
jgi:hypothetical protein